MKKWEHNRKLIFIFYQYVTGFVKNKSESEEEFVRQIIILIADVIDYTQHAH